MFNLYALNKIPALVDENIESQQEEQLNESLKIWNSHLSINRKGNDIDLFYHRLILLEDIWNKWCRLTQKSRNKYITQQEAIQRCKENLSQVLEFIIQELTAEWAHQRLYFKEKKTDFPPEMMYHPSLKNSTERWELLWQATVWLNENRPFLSVYPLLETNVENIPRRLIRIQHPKAILLLPEREAKACPLKPPRFPALQKGKMARYQWLTSNAHQRNSWLLHHQIPYQRDVSYSAIQWRHHPKFTDGLKILAAIEAELKQIKRYQNHLHPWFHQGTLQFLKQQQAYYETLQLQQFEELDQILEDGLRLGSDISANEAVEHFFALNKLAQDLLKLIRVNSSCERFKPKCQAIFRLIQWRVQQDRGQGEIIHSEPQHQGMENPIENLICRQFKEINWLHLILNDSATLQFKLQDFKAHLFAGLEFNIPLSEQQVEILLRLFWSHVLSIIKMMDRHNFSSIFKGIQIMLSFLKNVRPTLFETICTELETKLNAESLDEAIRLSKLWVQIYRPENQEELNHLTRNSPELKELVQQERQKFKLLKSAGQQFFQPSRKNVPAESQTISLLNQESIYASNAHH